MLRRLFNLSVLLSLLLLFASAALFIRSVFVRDEIRVYYWHDLPKGVDPLHAPPNRRWLVQLDIVSDTEVTRVSIKRTYAKPTDDPTLARQLAAAGATHQRLQAHYNDEVDYWIWYTFFRSSTEPGGANINRTGVYECWWLVVRARLLFLVFSSLPAIWWLLRWRKRRRARAGFCIVCGYDLRATPNKCPECGALPAVLPRVIQQRN